MRTSTDDSKEEGYIYKRRSSCIVVRLKVLKKNPRMIIEAEERYVSHSTGQGVQAQYRIISRVTL